MSHLRAVADEDIMASPAADAVEALARECIQAGATVVFMAWQTPDNMVHVRSWPLGGIVQNGFYKHFRGLDDE